VLSLSLVCGSGKCRVGEMPVLALLQDADAKVRCAAVQALAVLHAAPDREGGREGGSKAVEAVARALRDTDKRVRHASLETLHVLLGVFLSLSLSLFLSLFHFLSLSFTFSLSLSRPRALSPPPSLPLLSLYLSSLSLSARRSGTTAN